MCGVCGCVCGVCVVCVGVCVVCGCVGVGVCGVCVCVCVCVGVCVDVCVVCVCVCVCVCILTYIFCNLSSDCHIYFPSIETWVRFVKFGGLKNLARQQLRHLYLIGSYED